MLRVVGAGIGYVVQNVLSIQLIPAQAHIAPLSRGRSLSHMTSHCSSQCPCCASSLCRCSQAEMQSSTLLCRLLSQLMPAQAHSVRRVYGRQLCFLPFQLAYAQEVTVYMQHQQRLQWGGAAVHPPCSTLQSLQRCYLFIQRAAMRASQIVQMSAYELVPACTVAAAAWYAQAARCLCYSAKHSASC